MENEKFEELVEQLLEDRGVGSDITLKGKATVRERDPETGEVLSEEEAENLVVYEGMEKIASYINGDAPASDFDYMAIGSGSTAEDVGDTSLVTREDISSAITSTIVGDGSGNNRVVQWEYTFTAGTGKSSIEEMGMFDGNTDGTDTMLNRVTFTAKDNENNDLQITYELTVGA